MLTHLPMDYAVDKAVVADISQDAFTVLFNKMRAIADKLDVIVG